MYSQANNPKLSNPLSTCEECLYDFYYDGSSHLCDSCEAKTKEGE